MDEDELIRSYLAEYNKIHAEARDNNFTDAEIDQCFQDSCNYLTLETKRGNKIIKCSHLILIISAAILLTYILLSVHQPTSSLVLRNVQSFIYPGFTLVRHISMPIISLFPSLTALYDESCLIENPYFQVANLDCFPCENVHAVINLTGLTNNTLYESGTPFIITDKRKQVVIEDLIDLYMENEKAFDENASDVKSNNEQIRHIRDVLGSKVKIEGNMHIAWRINRMLPARYIRKLFPRPQFLSEWSGQSLERYVMIDGNEGEAYVLPGFECSYVFVVQGSGKRNILLQPTMECRHSCKTISVEMKPSYVLWYNWWYWKPLSLPSENSTNLSISYINSYC